MEQPGRDEFFAEIRSSAAQLAEIVGTSDPDLAVPTCPDWNLRQLGTHLGRVHRWAAEIVRARSAERIPFNSVPDGKYPAAAADRAAWINAGADRVCAAIGAAGDEPVWAFGRMAPASFWARRQAHETMMHRVDAELAIGREAALDAELAADGVDEWLESVTDPRYRQRGDGSQALAAGKALHLRATGTGEPGEDATAEWVIHSNDGGLSLHRGPGPADISVCGPADRLLLVLVRRVAPEDTSLVVTGDATLFSSWLAATPF